jgi:glycosyltransferase involved in cell wall biosynthesis
MTAASRPSPTGTPAPEVSIVMPCLNEAETLEACIVAAQRGLVAAGCAGEIIVADNGSTDGSTAIAERLGARVVPVALRGYGAALYFGARAAAGRFIVMGDSDDSYDFSQISSFIERMRAGDDVVIGNRFEGGIAPGAMPFKNRYLGNPVLSAVGRTLFRSRIGDFHCGLRALTRDAFAKLELRTTGMEFASEIVIKAAVLGLRVSEVPTPLRRDGRSRRPHLRPWRDGWRHLRYMLLCSPRWLFLYPGAMLMAVGIAVGAWLFAGPRLVGSVTLDIHTLMYAAVATLVGYQAVLFAIFARVFATQHRLLPRSPQLERAFEYFTLETGLAAGAALCIAGVALTLLEVARWRSTGFGPLNPTTAMRVVTLAAVSFTLGAQTVFASFFLSILGLGVRIYESVD